jgi:formate--tetrahydrofolate ligase
VATVQSLRAQGEGSLEAGFANLAHHVGMLHGYGVPVVVAINRFPADTAAELDAIEAECARLGVASATTEAFVKGGAGSTELARKVVAAIESNPTPEVHSLYAPEESLQQKIQKIARVVYGAEDADFSDAAHAKLVRCTEWGFGHLPVCVAKTQYSLTDDPKRMGAPTGWRLRVTDVSLSAGAGFVVAVAGNMMLMPGLPREPRALSIDVDDEGNLIGV